MTFVNWLWKISDSAIENNKILVLIPINRKNHRPIKSMPSMTLVAGVGFEGDEGRD